MFYTVSVVAQSATQSGGIDPTIWGAIILAISTILVTILTWVFKKKPGRVGAYDNVQEDLNELRKEFRQYRADQDDESQYTRAVIIHLENEVMTIRQAWPIGSPLPGRLPYPERIAKRGA